MGTGGGSDPQITVSDNGTSFETLTAGRFGVEAGKLIVAATGRSVRYIRGGAGGTTAVGWDADTNGVRTALVNRMKAAVAAGNTITALLLQVGWNDVDQALVTTVSAHAALLRSIISKIRSEAGLPNSPIIIGATQDARQARPTAIARQAELIVAGDANVSYGFSTYDLDTSDGIHQTEASHVISGGRFADQVIALLAGQPAKRGPIAASAAPVSGTQTDITLSHGSGTDFTPTSGISGFVLTDSSGAALAISAAARQSATVVRLTHATSGGQAMNALYMPDGGNADNGTILRDNAPRSLPMMPSSAALPIAATATPTPTPTPTPAARSAKVDFTGSSGPATPAGFNRWQTPTGATAAAPTPATLALLDPAGASTPWSLTTLVFNAVGNSPGASTGNNSGIVPDAVLQHYWYTSNADRTTMRIAGLTSGKSYRLQLIGSRAAPDRLVDFTVGDVTKTLNAGNNTQNAADFTFTATGTTQDFSFTRGAGMTFGYLNAAIFSELSS